MSALWLHGTGALKHFEQHEAFWPASFNHSRKEDAPFVFHNNLKTSSNIFIALILYQIWDLFGGSETTYPTGALEC